MEVQLLSWLFERRSLGRIQRHGMNGRKQFLESRLKSTTKVTRQASLTGLLTCGLLHCGLRYVQMLLMTHQMHTLPIMVNSTEIQSMHVLCGTHIPVCTPFQRVKLQLWYNITRIAYRCCCHIRQYYHYCEQRRNWSRQGCLLACKHHLVFNKCNRSDISSNKLWIEEPWIPKLWDLPDMSPLLDERIRNLQFS